jgi:NADPH-dependent 2,4-dienoyl-CoA reductase/sulfur reductase-like enzyme
MELVEVIYNSVKEYHRINEAIFRDNTGNLHKLDYGHLNHYPRGKIPEVLAKSKLVGQDGKVPVNKYTLQHDVFKNVFGLGECTNLPTLNNCFAVMPQTHVVAYNLNYVKSNQEPKKKYDGTTCTPIFTGLAKLAMPGYNYEGRRVGTQLAADLEGSMSGLKQSFSFKLFARYWKKWFEKRMGGKIYGPPKWTKPGPETAKAVKADAPVSKAAPAAPAADKAAPAAPAAAKA